MAVERHPPPMVGGRRIKPKYMAQIKARPPTFVLFASRASAITDSYKRYLINSIRQSFELPGTPIRLTMKSSANPYTEDGSGDTRRAAKPRSAKWDAPKAGATPGAAKAKPRGAKPATAKTNAKKAGAKPKPPARGRPANRAKPPSKTGARVRPPPRGPRS